MCGCEPTFNKTRSPAPVASRGARVLSEIHPPWSILFGKCFIHKANTCDVSGTSSQFPNKPSPVGRRVMDPLGGTDQQQGPR